MRAIIPQLESRIKDGKTNVSELMLLFKDAAKKLKAPFFRRWAQHETKGYGPLANENLPPKYATYRIVEGKPIICVLRRIKGQTYLSSTQISEIKADLSRIFIDWSLIDIEAKVVDKSLEHVDLPYPAESVKLIKGSYPDLVSAEIRVSRASLEKILYVCKEKILDRVAKLSNAGILGRSGYFNEEELAKLPGIGVRVGTISGHLEQKISAEAATKTREIINDVRRLLIEQGSDEGHLQNVKSQLDDIEKIAKGSTSPSEAKAKLGLFSNALNAITTTATSVEAVHKIINAVKETIQLIN